MPERFPRLSPLPFKEAAASIAARRSLSTTLSSAELMRIRADVRERSMFSACTVFAEHLQSIRSVVDEIVDGKLDIATGRLALKESLKSISYQPSVEDRGTIKDLSSDQRLNLIIKTNTELAQGYGRHVQGQHPEVLDQFPAQELVRREDRKEKRNWRERWIGAGGKIFAGHGPDEEGRLVALKNDPVWERLSAFGLPYPPFDFGSGIGVEDVSRTEAMDMGLIDLNTQVTPDLRGFNEGQESSLALDPAMKAAVLDSLGDGYAFKGNTLVRTAQE